MTTSEMIRKLCKESKISLSELARRMGQSPQNFSQKLKRESLTISELDRIYELLHVKAKLEHISKTRSAEVPPQKGLKADIEPEKANRKAVSALEASEQANKAKSEIISNLSQEVKPPLKDNIEMSALQKQDCKDPESVLDKSEKTFAAGIIPPQAEEKEDDPDFWKKHSLMHMLLADDDRNVCTAVKSAMSGTGVRTEYAESGKRALEKIKNSHIHHDDFSIALIDWKMPEMDGIETARQARRYLHDKVFIILMTEQDYSVIADKAKEAGVDGFMQKPFLRSELQKEIEKLIK